MSDPINDPEFGDLKALLDLGPPGPGDGYEASALCVCGKTLRQHKTQWPACPGFLGADVGRLTPVLDMAGNLVRYVRYVREDTRRHVVTPDGRALASMRDFTDAVSIRDDQEELLADALERWGNG